MLRREFIAGLGSVAVWPVVARAQQPSQVRRVGVLLVGVESGNRAYRTPGVAAFTQALAGLGWIDGRNVRMDLRSSGSDINRIRALAQELVGLQPDIILAVTTAVTVALQRETRTIPIVFVIGADPVKFGIVGSINRPGANVTGISLLTNSLTPKRLEMLRLLMPQAANVAFLVNPSNPNAEPDAKDTQAAARALGLSLLVLNASTESDIEAGFANIGREHAEALLVSSDGFLDSHRDQLIALAAQHAIPSIYEYREAPFAGGLMSYGPSVSDSFRQAGVYVGRILKGEKPADLPVQQSTKIDLVINMKTAKALGLTIPETLLVRANEVIE
jgi:putative tryptophan/tyrosine transport system substrate-binding protein